MFLDVDKPLPRVRPVIFRRAVTVVMFVFLALPLSILWGAAIGIGEAVGFLRDCWNGEDA